MFSKFLKVRITVFLGCLVFITFQGAGAPLLLTSESAALEQQIGELANSAGGNVGVLVLHGEIDRSIGSIANAKLPLYSVLKFPLAFTVFKPIEQKNQATE